MPTVTALLASDPGTTVDVPTSSNVQLLVPRGVAGALQWTKNASSIDLPDNPIVDPTPGHDDIYAATDGTTTWSVVVRWQPDPPGSVTLSPGRGIATVGWPAVPNEGQLSYYEVALDPQPATAQLPRRVKRSAASRGTQRKLTIDGLPPDLYTGTVKSARTGPFGTVTSSPASTGVAAEVVPGTQTYRFWVRAVLLLVAVALVVGAVLVLRSDPSSGNPKHVSLNSWALWVAVIADLAIFAFLAAIVNPIGLLLGPDNRLSTSRVNVGVWTVVIAFGIITLAAFAYGAAKYHIVNPCASKAPKSNAGDGICVNGHATAVGLLDLAHTFKGGLTPNYLVLLGAPFVTLAGSAFIVNRQIGAGDRQKVQSTGPAQFTDALTNDDGSADLVDSQYLVFTGVLLFYFLTSFLPRPSRLPDLPWGLVGLTGVSAGTYLLNKSVATNGLTITSLESSTIKAGASDRVLGQNFLPEGSSGLPAGGVSVLLEGTNAPVTKVSNSEIVFMVPSDTPTGTYNVQVTTAANVTASAGSLKVT